MQLIDQATATSFIRTMAPEWTEFLEHIESENGYVGLPGRFVKIIARLKVENYPELYEDEKRIGAMLLRAFMEPDEILALEAELAGASLQDRGKYFEEVSADLMGAGETMSVPLTLAEYKQSRRQFKALPKEEQQKKIVVVQRLLMALLASFYQALSVMVHGEKLTSLVAQAKMGSDKAFAKAVQIDKRILFAIPYFKKRYTDASTMGDHKFTEYVGAHLERPPYKGRIHHKALYLAFVLLDMAGLLKTMKHKDLLDLCIEAGLDTPTNRIVDVKNMTKRLAEYWKFQQRGIVLSTP